MLRDMLCLSIALAGVALIVSMYLRLSTFPPRGREAIFAAALGMFVASKYLAFATTMQDYIFGLAVAGYMGYFGSSQFRIFPRTTM